jgi:hypothetical protein
VAAASRPSRTNAPTSPRRLRRRRPARDPLDRGDPRRGRNLADGLRRGPTDLERGPDFAADRVIDRLVDEYFEILDGIETDIEVVEAGTLEIGRFIAIGPLSLAITVALGLALVPGILRAVGFEKIAADRLFGLVPDRPVGILVIAFGLALVLMTVRGRVDRARPDVAASQRLVTGTVMATGAALGDILPGT